MIRFLVLVIVVLFIAGLALIAVPFVFPEAAQWLAPVLCPDGGSVATREVPSQLPASRPGSNTPSLVLTCEGADARDSNPSMAGTVLLVTGWLWLPLIPLLVLFVVRRRHERAEAQAPRLPDLP